MGHGRKGVYVIHTCAQVAMDGAYLPCLSLAVLLEEGWHC